MGFANTMRRLIFRNLQFSLLLASESSEACRNEWLVRHRIRHILKPKCWLEATVFSSANTRGSLGKVEHCLANPVLYYLWFLNDKGIFRCIPWGWLGCE